MTGAAVKLAEKPPRPNSGEPEPSEAPSLPLYLAGLVITLCGVLAANAALSVPDYTWMLDTVLLTGLGFLFSFGSRRLGISSRFFDLGFVALALLLLAAVESGQLALEQFLPVGADRGDLHLLATLAWGGTLWTWALRSDVRVMLTTVPAMAALGLASEVDLNTPVQVCFGVFILTVIFLLIHQNFLQNRARAARTEREQPPGRLLLAQFGQTISCALAVLLAGLVVIVPAQAAFSRLSLAQAIRQLTGLGHVGPNVGSPALRFSDDDNLQIGTGDAWSSSAEVVMRVTPSDGQEHLWRGRTYDQYTGDGWQSSQENQKTALTDSSPSDGGWSWPIPAGLMPGVSPAPASVPLLTATFKVIGDTGQFYYAADPRRIILSRDIGRFGRGPQVYRDGRLDLTDRSAVRFSYVIASQPTPDPMQPSVQERLRRAGKAYPTEIRRLYLSQGVSDITQPDDLAFYRQMLAQAVSGLPTNQRDPLDEAFAIRAWVANRCVYTLLVPPIPPEADHVHAFLGDTRRGYCDMFASSMAVLCRTAGIPARLATGFAPGEADGDSFNLRGEDKHAWTEVYFPRVGWVAFDPTAGSRTDGTVPNAQGKHSGNWLSRLRFALGAGWEFVWPLLAFIGLILAYVVKTELYDRWRARRRGAAPPEGLPRAALRTGLGRQYARLTRALARLGLPRRPSETPGEYAVRAVPFLAVQERELGVLLPSAVVTELSGAFALACYAGPGLEDVETENWERAVMQLDAAVRRTPVASFLAKFRSRQTRNKEGGGKPGPYAASVMELDYSKLAKGFPKPIQRVYLLLGSDDALKREALLKLTGPLLDPSFADFDREERDVPPTGAGEAGEAARAILASAGGVPMASQRRVVVVTNVHRLGKEDQDQLAAGLPKLGELSCLVLIAGATEYDAGKVKGRTAVGTKLVNAAAKSGATVLCDAPGESGLQARANALLKARGKTMETAALALVMDRAKATASERGGGGRTGDINVLLNELEKAIAHAGDRAQVTRADAIAVGLHTVQDNIFTLLDAVGHRDARRALAEADNLLEAGDKPDAVAARTFVMLARHLRQVWGAKYLADQRLNGFNLKGGLPPEVQSALSGEMLGITQRQSYRLKDLQEQARGWTYPHLRDGLHRILASDLAMKSIPPGAALNARAPADDPASNLRLLVVALCRTGQE